jgi:hypothetical protein
MPKSNRFSCCLLTTLNANYFEPVIQLAISQMPAQSKQLRRGKKNKKNNNEP